MSLKFSLGFWQWTTWDPMIPFGASKFRHPFNSRAVRVSLVNKAGGWIELSHFGKVMIYGIVDDIGGEVMIYGMILNFEL